MRICADHLHTACRTQIGEERADLYVRRIIAFCNRCTTSPERGTPRGDILPGLRERRITIAFIVTAHAVLIEGIFYGGQDFEAAFRARQ